ncbi:MAG: twin-arginine translocase TatA/TatE family subunit [Deltaproteobacteria bacterium]|nr:twin-arginine translocase TatA/TatE family subunit [Deltaproteobacteria bacterium]
MFGIGFGELILVLAAALIFIGPDRLPAMAKTLARALNEFKKAGDEMKTAITSSLPGMEERQKSYAAKGSPVVKAAPAANDAGAGDAQENAPDKGPEGGASTGA